MIDMWSLQIQAMVLTVCQQGESSIFQFFNPSCHCPVCFDSMLPLQGEGGGEAFPKSGAVSTPKCITFDTQTAQL